MWFKAKTSADHLTPIQIVGALYRSMLGREPDAGGVDHYLGRMRTAGLEAVVNDFLSSDEFAAHRAGTPAATTDLNRAPPMIVESTPDASQLDALWRHIADVWSAYGRDEPLWSVLTDDRFRSAQTPSGEVLDAFYASGMGDVAYFDAFLARAGLADARFPVVAEYGCGVGRVTRWLAPRFPQVRAFDISMPHLDGARDYLSRQGIANVDFVLMKSRQDLVALTGIDLFFSMIVLQHNPPPIILDILDHAFAGLNAGGIAFFQVPTYAIDYQFRIADYWSGVAAQKSMEVHFVPQADIMAKAAEHGLHLIETRQDHCVGNQHRWISNTFLLRKA